MIYKPYKFLIYGQAVYLIFLIFGPYDYTLYSVSGALYMAFGFSLFTFFAWIFDRPYKKDNGSVLENIAIISTNAELFLIAVIILSYVAFGIHLIYVLTLPIEGGYQFAGDDYRDILSVGRPTWDKIAEMAINIGTAAYLIIARIKETNLKHTKFLATIALFLPAVSILAVGARSRVITSIGLFIIVYGMNRFEGHMFPKMKRGNSTKHKLFFVCSFIILAYFTLSLFATRGVMDAPDQYLRYPGDTALKPIYLSLYEATSGGVGPLYKGALYYTHSAPVFTWAIDQFREIELHFGAYLFYLEGYFLRLFNIPFPDYLMIAGQSPVAGLYSTFITGYLLDWGKIGTLVMVALTGVLFGRISYRSKERQFSYFVLPVVLFMCWVSPIYYFWHMGWESVLLWFACIYPISRWLGLSRSKRISAP